MSEPLYMVQLELGQSALVRFLAWQGLNSALDEDLGYGVHAWLKATFGELAPKPFRVFQQPTSSEKIRLLGYGSAGQDELLSYASTFAEPVARAVSDLQKDMAVAPMPVAEKWRLGQTLAFEILLCPVSRKSRNGREQDVFLCRVESAGQSNELEREPVYIDWLQARLGSAARLDGVRLREFRLVHQLRQGTRKADSERSKITLTRPRALVDGRLTVANADALHSLLACGVGRHRAFGYGMLLLRPIK